jgi:hypothetical protein
MKKLAAILGLIILSTSVYATHAYRSEVCQSDTHKLVYKGNYPVGGSYGLSDLKGAEEIELWTKEDDSKTEENEFEVINAKTIKNDTIKASCRDGDEIDFDETEFTTEKVIKFNRISTEDEKKSGMNSGSLMIFKCSENLSIPVHCKL